MKISVILIPAALLLAACEQAEAPTGDADAPAGTATAPEPPAAANSATPGGNSITYSCSNGQDVTAVYGKDAGGKPNATLTIAGRDYTLASAVSASGARYTSENGPTPGMLLEWWTKGTEATWYESPLDDSVKPEDKKQIATCTEKAPV